MPNNRHHLHQSLALPVAPPSGSDTRGRVLLVIAGCNLAYTPVVADYINLAKNNGYTVEVVQYSNFKRRRFLKHAIQLLLRHEQARLLCVNNQALPIALMAGWLKYNMEITYWKLESNKPFENWSIASNLPMLEHLLPRRRVALVLPSTQRLEIQKPHFKKSFVIYNAPVSPRKETPPERTRIARPLSLVLYGTIRDPADVYLNEWVKAANSTPRLRLTIIGNTGADSENITWRGRVSHEDLIAELENPDGFHFSIVGYNPRNQNNRLAAPNKLLESLACGLPVIGCDKNSYVTGIINKYSCGVIMDFSNINPATLFLSTEDYQVMARGALNAARDLCLSNSIKSTPLSL